MKRLLFVLIGVILSGSALFAQDKKALPVCLGPATYGNNARFMASQRYVPERSGYLLDVHAVICNMTTKPKKVKVTVTLKDAKGKVVNSRKESVSVAAGSGYQYTTFLPVAKPNLWDGVGEPYLYKVSVAAGKDYSETDFYFKK